MPLTPFSPVFNDGDSPFDAPPPLSENGAVGLRHFYATDSTRDDISTGHRQFMVSVFYPAMPSEMGLCARLADILAPHCEKALQILARDSQLSSEEKDVALARLQSLTLRAQRDLLPVTQGTGPVLIYYPGGASHRFSNAALCEGLASVGYFVFALDAPRDAPIVVFPEGQLVPFLPNNDENYIWPRVADIRFLLDQLEPLNTTGAFAGKLDLNCIGMFGHSRGGYLSNICAVEDARIKAAVNMDGLLWGLWTDGTGLEHYPPDFQERARTLKTPVLQLRSEPQSPERAQRAFDEEVKDFGGDFISIALHGYRHDSFSTTPYLNGVPESFARNLAQTPPTMAQIELLTELLRDFFDTYLLHRQPRMQLLAKQSTRMDVFHRIQS